MTNYQVKSGTDSVLDSLPALPIELTAEVKPVRFEKTAQARPEKMHALTSLRFFAALYVVVFHTLFLVAPNLTDGAGANSMAGRIAGLGYISVSFFFLLSGYILSVVYLQGDKPVRRRNFYVARMARVYPLFLATALLDTPHLLFARIAKYGVKVAYLKTFVTLAANVLVVHSWSMQLKGIDDPNWSLGVEAFFYLIFPFAGVLLWKLRGTGLWTAVAALYVAGQALTFLAGRQLPEDIAFYHPVLHVSTFLLGVLLARWQVLRADSISAEAMGRSKIVALLLACAGFAVVLWQLPLLPHSMLRDGLLAPIFACVIWAFSGSSGWLVRPLSSPLLVLLGEASFGLYLIHIPVLHLYQHFGWPHPLPAYLLYLVLCIGLSVLSFYYFETPARVWILRKWKTRTVESLEASSNAQ